MLKFFLNPNTSAYLRGLAEEFGESTNAVRVELNRFAEAGLLNSSEEGRKKIYKANKSHKLFKDLHTIVQKFIGIDQLVEQVVNKLGNVKVAYITGDYARGIDSGTIDLVIIGEVDSNYLKNLVEKTERMIERKVDVKVLAKGCLNEDIDSDDILVVWGQLS